MGVGVGALVGLLFAPASGKRTRKFITGSVKQGLSPRLEVYSRGQARFPPKDTFALNLL